MQQWCFCKRPETMLKLDHHSSSFAIATQSHFFSAIELLQIFICNNFNNSQQQQHQINRKFIQSLKKYILYCTKEWYHVNVCYFNGPFVSTIIMLNHEKSLFIYKMSV